MWVWKWLNPGIDLIHPSIGVSEPPWESISFTHYKTTTRTRMPNSALKCRIIILITARSFCSSNNILIKFGQLYSNSCYTNFSIATLGMCIVCELHQLWAVRPRIYHIFRHLTKRLIFSRTGRASSVSTCEFNPLASDDAFPPCASNFKLPPTMGRKNFSIPASSAPLKVRAQNKSLSHLEIRDISLVQEHLQSYFWPREEFALHVVARNLDRRSTFRGWKYNHIDR